MTQETNTLDFRKWIIAVLLALLLHFLVLLYQAQWLTLPKRASVEVQQIDPAKLEAIRKQWSKSLLLKPNKAAETKDAPDDARYFSDRNTRVDKEQRARISDVMPKAGKTGQEAKKEMAHPVPLSNLGVPMKFALAPITQPAPQSERGENAADQSILDKNLTEGNQNLLNTQESVYYSFYARIYEAIGPVWQSMVRNHKYQSKVTPGDYTTQVTVVLNKEGQLVNIIRDQSSGINEIDMIVEEAWKKIRNFPNPPSGLVSQDGLVAMKWTFRLAINTSYGIDYLPPERRN
jgi:hypothetical protein